MFDDQYHYAYGTVVGENMDEAMEGRREEAASS